MINGLRALQKMETIRMFLCDGYFLKTASLSQKTQYNTYNLQWASLAPSYYLTSGSPPPSLTPHPHTAGSHCKVFFEQVITLKLGRTLFFEFGWGGEAVPWQLGKSALHLSPVPGKILSKLGKVLLCFNASDTFPLQNT